MTAEPESEHDPTWRTDVERTEKTAPTGSRVKRYVLLVAPRAEAANTPARVRLRTRGGDDA